MAEKIKLYHFLNLGFGLPFLKLYQDSFIEKKVNLNLIFSAKRYRILTNDSFSTSIKKKIRKQRSYYQLLKKIKLNQDVKIDFISNVNADEFIRQIPSGAIAICTGFNQIFCQELIEKYDTFVNVHPSILPFYRGPVPSYWCLQYGERYTGYTIHEVTNRIDEGRILSQAAILIPDAVSEQKLDQLIAQNALNDVEQYYIHLISGQAFPYKKIDAKQYYINKVGYRSFPFQ